MKYWAIKEPGTNYFVMCHPDRSFCVEYFVDLQEYDDWAEAESEGYQVCVVDINHSV